jgi:hypothetical protein
MAETYAQRKAAVRKSLRQVKQALNVNNAMLEKTRREADRLLDRKTIITSESLNKLDQEWKSTVISSNLTTSALTRLWQIARSYM